MKVKKVLSLALALVMVFSMIPAQLIVSKGLDSKIGNAVTNVIDVSIAGEDAGNYAGCIDVALKLQVSGYMSLAEGAERQITMANQIITIDPTVLSTVVKTPPTKRGTPNMDAMLTAIEASANKTVPGSGNWGNAGESVPTYEGATGGDIVSFSTDTSALGYSTDSSKVFIMVNSMCASGYENWDELDDFTITVAHVYLKPQEGKTLQQCKDAIEYATDADLNEAGIPAVMKGGANRVSSKMESFVECGVAEMAFSPDFDPVASTYTITFTGLVDANGQPIEDVVRTEVEEGTTPEAPEVTESYTDGDYDYAFTGWDKEIVAATEDATYTAVYTKQQNDKKPLQDEVTADAALDENNYTPETWAPFAEKLSAAQTVLSQDNPTKGDLQTALNELVAAKARLEAKATMHEITFAWTTAEGAQSQVVPTAEGSVPVPPEGSTANYEDSTKTYTFNGWDKEIVAATGATTYTAQYTPDTKVAQLTFNYNTVDGPQSYGISADYGTEASAYVPEDAKTYDSADGSYTYELTGWSPALGTVNGDETYTAAYNTIENPADYSAVDNAILAANEKTAETGYADKYTAQSRQVLTDAVNGVVRGLLAGDQATVEAMADAITQAINRLQVQQYNVTYAVTGKDPVVTPYDYGTPAATVEAGAPNVTDYDEGDYHYTFTGWSPDFADVTANATYTATFNDAFVPADTDALQTAVNDKIAERDSGTEWTDDSVAALNQKLDEATQYLNPPAPVGQSKQGAIDALTNAIKNSTLVPKGQHVTTYTIVFQDWDGREISTQNVNAGDTITVPENPTRPDSDDGNTSYTFTGWGKDVVMVPTQDETYTAQYSETTNYADLDELEAAIDTAQGKITAESEIFDEKYANATDFRGLISDAQALVDSAPLKSQQGDVDAKRDALNNFELTPNQFTITFITHEGTTERIVDYGVTAQAPATPNYTENDYEYAFVTWTVDQQPADIAPATADVTYTAQYDDGTFLPADYNENNAAVEAANAILENADKDKIYEGDSLTALQNAVNENVQPGLGESHQTEVDNATTAINDALNNMQKKVYTVTFKVEGKVHSSNSYFYNDDLTVQENPVKAADDTYTYTFNNWGVDTLPEKVTANAEYYADFTADYINYTITFLVDGEIYDTQILHYGDDVQAPADPTKESTVSTDYNFVGWEPAIAPVAGNDTYMAVFEETTRKYTITFVDEDQTPIDTIEVAYGTTPTAPADPTKAADNTYTYSFAGWTPAVHAVDGPQTYVASYTPTYIDYTIRFLVDGNEYDKQTLHFGDTIVLPENPTKAPSVSTVYTFTNWAPDVEDTCKGNADYDAVFSESPRMYTITVITKSSTDASEVTDTMSVAFGDTPELTTPATGFVVDGQRYDFTGWDPTVAPVDGEAVYTAQYTQTPVQGQTYTINFKYAENAEQAVSGNYASHETVYEEGSQVTQPEPQNFSTETDTYTFTGWDKTVTTAQADTTYVAQYTVAPIVDEYTINFRYAEEFAQVEDGHLVDHNQTVAKGQMPTIPPVQETFTDGSTTYTFVSWDKEVVEATENAVYTAVYKTEPVFVPDMTEIDDLNAKYKQMVQSRQYVEEDLKAIKAYIDDIYAKFDADEFTSQDEIDKMADQLRYLEDNARKIESDKEETKKDERTSERTSYRRSASTGDNASLIIMSVILVSSIGIAFVSIKKRKKDF